MTQDNLKDNDSKKKNNSRIIYLIIGVLFSDFLFVLSYLAYSYDYLSPSIILALFGIIILLQSVLMLKGNSLARIFNVDNSKLPDKCPICKTSLRATNSALFINRIVAGGSSRAMLIKCPKCGHEIVPVGQNKL